MCLEPTYDSWHHKLSEHRLLAKTMFVVKNRWYYLRVDTQIITQSSVLQGIISRH